jgi:Cu-Zn family superoxide dismutase
MRCLVLTGLVVAGCTGVDRDVLPQLARGYAPVNSAAQQPVAPFVPLKPKSPEVPVSGEARMDPAKPSSEGQPVRGSARFVIDRGVVTMDLLMDHLPQGTHAVALQDNCESEHWNPTGTTHGRFDVPPFHLGDVGNFFADENGHASVIFSTELWSIGTGLPNDVVGKVIAVRERRDDFKTQPTGAAGEVIACGHIELSQMTQPAVSMMGALLDR